MVVRSIVKGKVIKNPRQQGAMTLQGGWRGSGGRGEGHWSGVMQIFITLQSH